jgi:hypothetical protein
MDSMNIESDNVDDLNDQPLKKPRISESCELESELDKQATSCDLSLSPPSPSSMVSPISTSYIIVICLNFNLIDNFIYIVFIYSAVSEYSI